MRKPVICLAAVAALLGPVATASAGTGTGTGTTVTSGPTPAQIQAAVTDAESSAYLWETVNECQAKGAGGSIGIRGQMPALGFAATLSMTIQLRQYDKATDGYTAFTGGTGTRTLALGRFASHLHQSGAVFPFSANPGKVQASVTFTWARGGQTIGTVTEQTTAGHPQADYGTPAHYSAADCSL
jgi:hypothetical protein